MWLNPSSEEVHHKPEKTDSELPFWRFINANSFFVSEYM